MRELCRRFTTLPRSSGQRKRSSFKKIRKQVLIMKVKKLDEAEREGFKPQWVASSYLRRLENPKIGYLERVAICDESGKPMYDQWQMTDNPGAIVVPHYFDKPSRETYIGLITQIRPVVMDPRTGEQGNIRTLEVPRGLAIKGESSEE